MVYLRARYYAPGMGRFLTRDTWEADTNSPMSFNRWLYVEGNPVNRADPTGLYGPEVHSELTHRVVLELGPIASVVSPIHGLNALANRIADGNQHVDDAVGTLDPIVSCRECHFYPLPKTMKHVEEAVKAVNPYLFGASLHQLQDWYSHWKEGYTGGGAGHAPHDVLAGKWTGGRTWIQRQDFFKGWHLEPVFPYYRPSPFPAHPKEEVIANLKRRNPGIVLAGLSDDDLISLYLRKDTIDTANWQTRKAERNYFGYVTDLSIPSSAREKEMYSMTKVYVLDFLLRISEDGCLVDWSIPDDDTIKALLIK
jgi:hypothetical protein